MVQLRWHTSVSEESEVTLSTENFPEVLVFALNGLPCQPYHRLSDWLGKRFLELLGAVKQEGEEPGTRSTLSFSLESYSCCIQPALNSNLTVRRPPPRPFRSAAGALPRRARILHIMT